MKILQVENVPVIPAPPWLQESERAFKAELTELHSLGTNEQGEAEMAWKAHKREQGYDDLIHPVFGKPTGPADKLLPYTRRARGK